MKPSEEIAEILRGPTKTDPKFAELMRTGQYPDYGSPLEVLRSYGLIMLAQERAIKRVADILDGLVQ